MGYLNNSTITVDAILTKKGRELLSKGQSQFNITQFAVADDEVDYTLYTTSHPLGSSYYGAIIENMPVLEASPDETQSMRYKLVSLDRGTKEIPTISLGVTGYSLNYNDSITVNPTTTSELATAGYTAIIYDGTIVTLSTGAPLPTGTTTPFFAANQAVSANAVVVQGFTFNLTAKELTVDRQTQLVIVNNLTGATKTVTVTVNAKPLLV
jgi:hypothetical protein